MASPLPPGAYPAAVTPFDDGGQVDELSLARLLAYFEAAGCQGAVLAGTNGEGPSLSAVEKRDLLRIADRGRGRLKLVLGVSTPSLTEAMWLCSQAGKNGADAVLLMPPGYFRNVSETGVEGWFHRVLESSAVPVLVYNFPKMTGLRLSAAMIARLTTHERFAGVKDSSGERDNLEAFRAAVPDWCSLFVGDETLLIPALAAGWTGTISGAANVVPGWLSRVCGLWHDGQVEEAKAVFDLVAPVVTAVRASPQPATNKAALHALGILSSGEPRLPLEPVGAEGLLAELEARLGVTRSMLGLPA